MGNNLQQSLIILNSCPDREVAQQLARRLVEKREAACVNLLDNVHSVYRWNNEVEEEQETLLVIKTTAACYPAVEATIQQEHPYELPEIVALPIEQGSAPYLSWLAHSTNTKITDNRQ
ncbi:MAG: divalent-cation tolerance protein CutA [Gammaproteobacteria bacterium]|nr:divalent-cation tolerance protein CutA [Gammaproteobacteria bacterium]